MNDETELRTMKVVWLDKPLNEAYDRFVENHPAGMLYYSRKYHDLVSTLTGARPLNRIVVEGGIVRGVWPSMVRDGTWGAVANSLPYFGSHGAPLVDSREVADVLRQTVAADTGPSACALSVIIENPFAPVDVDLPYDVLDERTSQITQLAAPEEILGRIDPSARRNIRKAETSGVTVAVEHDALDFLYATHVTNMAEIGGLPKVRNFFDLIPRIFTERDEWDLYVARIAGEPVAALLVFYFGSKVEYFTPVTVHSARNAQPTAAILRRAMADAWERGFTYWNWGGTWLTQHGVYRFKQKWGAQDRRYRYFVRIHNREILERTRSELSEAYPGMYTVPFSMLGATA